jgi:hypothetical protein
MSVGPLSSHTTVLCGFLTVTLTDGNGEIIAVRRKANIVSSWAKKAMALAMFSAVATSQSAYFTGGAAGVGAPAIFIWVGSGMTATPTISMPGLFSGNPGANASINNTNQPLTATFSWINDTQWSINGTMTWLGYGQYSSIDCAALCFGSFATTSASFYDRSGAASWFAMACFTDLAINSVDKLSFNWAFSLSGTTSTNV